MDLAGTTVSLINMKGGVGKSTLTVNLAWHFAKRRNRVLVVDLDPQFNASQYMLGVSEYETLLREECPTIKEVFERSIDPSSDGGLVMSPTEPIRRVARYGGSGQLDLIPSRLELAFLLRNPRGKE